MRLHHLEVTAFGPFAETASVDFDVLSDAGLFLLTGATGAGKTSVLDAVCFALYGEVPGDRQSAKRLRSDQAAPGTPPRVTLELSLSGRRYRVIRSPAWERPKKRGVGVTTEQASVKFFEHGDDGWSLLSHRLDETGHLVTHLVGMNLTQFCQVAMLPQGRFQAFLRARSEERHQLLQQLFRTTRFEQIERWLRERRTTLRRASARHHESVADLVSRVSEAAGSPLPDDWDVHDLVQPAAAGELARWSGAHHARAVATAGEHAAAGAAATSAEQAARRSLEQARRLVELQRSHAAAAAERARLGAAHTDHQGRVTRLAAARRAAAVVPLERLSVRAQRAGEAAAEESRLRTRTVAVRLGSAAGELNLSCLQSELQRARDAAARARGLLPREQSLATLREQVTSSQEEVEHLEHRRASLSQRLTELPDRLAEVRTEHAAAVEAGHALAAVRAELASLRTRQQGARQAVELRDRLAEARILLTAAVDDAQLRKEIWLQLQEERISGMAAEIAGALAVGDDCPVCGSIDHPRLAPSRPGSPDASAEKEARRRVDDAEATRHAHDVAVRDLQTRLQLAEQAAGEEPRLLDDAVQRAGADAERLAATAASTTRAATRLRALEEEIERTTHAREEAGLALTSARAALAASQAQADAVGRDLAEALEGSGCDSVAELLSRQERLVDDCEVAVEAAIALEQARLTEQEALRDARDAAATAGFATVDSALAAALDDAAVHELEQAVVAHEAALSRVSALLDDAELRAASTAPAPDVAAAEEQHVLADEALARARTELALADARARRLTGLDTDLRTALDEWAPVRDDLLLTTRVCALADGTSADNSLQMRLSGYVLAWRLSQVVDAANERLSRMSDQRYSLEHSGRRGAGETRGGLSLLVRDDWSGETRDPATLSGGETFVVSLALALGLADVIAHEVGGADLDTLFVDEGFGSLDADTLDDVMDTLDSLRDGGRVVGVVSHVAEMRDRIPSQVRVTKSRSGSTVQLAR